MTDTNISPNMNMPVPVVSQAPGPDWASDIDACLSIVDQHNHATGQGVPVTPSGLLINVDLSFQSNNATALRSARFTPQGSPLSQPADIGCLYESGADLYYNDAAGNQIRITQGGAVAGAAGTITGLPSGTASASFSSVGGGRFTFISATGIPANFSIGPVTIGLNSAGTKFVTLTPNAAQASNYSMIFPPALPASANYMTLDASGNLSFNSSGNTGSGAVVLATSPTLSGTVGGNLIFSGLLQARSGLQNTAFTNTTTSSSVTLTISDNPHQIFTSITGATTVVLPTTGVKAGDTWTIDVTATNKVITVQASDASEFTVQTNGTSGQIAATPTQVLGRMMVTAKIDTPVASTDWQIVQVLDAGTWSGTTSSSITQPFQANYSRINNTVTCNVRSDSANPSGNAITITGLPDRIRPYGGNQWASCVLTNNNVAAAGTAQILPPSSNQINFFKYDFGNFSGLTGLGGANVSSPSGSTFTYSLYNNF